MLVISKTVVSGRIEETYVVLGWLHLTYPIIERGIKLRGWIDQMPCDKGGGLNATEYGPQVLSILTNSGQHYSCGIY